MKIIQENELQTTARGSLSLKGKTALLKPLQWETKNQDLPRTLRNLAYIVNDDLCHRCGSCIGICPTNVLGLSDEEYPEVKDLNSCTDCNLCVKVCPGDSFNAGEFSQSMFNCTPDVMDMHGHFVKGYLSFAEDPEVRELSTSGGLITALLIHLLDTKQIDGAVVIASDENVPWKGKPIIARTSKEVLSATKSKYAISPTNVVLSEIRAHPGRYALVGLPCQIHGFHKAAQLDKKIKERVVLTIGVLCHAAIEHEPMRFIWDNIKAPKEKIKRFISRVGKHPGTPHIELNDGTLVPVYFPEAKGYRPSSMEIINLLYRLYTPARCLTCYDATAEYADICAGDPWMAPPSDNINFLDGYSYVLARTEKAKKLLQNAENEKAISLIPLDEQTTRTSNKMMGQEKRWRAFYLLKKRREQGLPIPDYGFNIPKANTKHSLLTSINLLTHIFCFIKKGRLSILKLLFSPLGYNLLWLNHKRRRFREWRRDTRAKLHRKA